MSTVPSREARPIPAVELHVHLNGTLTQAMRQKLGDRHGMPIPQGMFSEDGKAIWESFSDFHAVYHAGSAVVRTPRDFEDVTYDYLKRAAEEGAIYVELAASPDKTGRGGHGFSDNLNGIAAGIRRAEQEFGIVARIIVTAKRHRGPADAERIARECVRHPNPYVTGFGLAGDETTHSPGLFRRAFEIAKHEAGLRCTAHVGEARGAEDVWEAIRTLPLDRIDHGLAAAGDPALLAELAKRNMPLTICPTSNVQLEFVKSLPDHPLPRFREAGIPISINTDDPSYFHTTIGQEYRAVQQAFRMTREEMLDISRQAIRSAFVDEPTRQRLLARLDEGNSRRPTGPARAPARTARPAAARPQP